MQDLTAEGRAILEGVAQRHGASVDAVTALMAAVVAGGGRQAQFNIPELGGMGQWSSGGMTMVGDMFNTGLKARVDALCSELAGLIGGTQVYSASEGQDAGMFVSGGDAGVWWPEGLGWAASTGAQNDLRYAVFPETRRLAVEIAGRVTVYDTGDHRIGGVSQQQSRDRSLSFTSQHGPVRAADLPVVSGRPEPQAAAGPETPARGASGDDDPFSKIERLALLRDKGVLTDEEFAAKKAELLARL